MVDEKVPHPAKFSDPILKIVEVALGQAVAPGARVLDPQAGTGKGCDFLAGLGYDAVGVEIEPEWAVQSPLVFVGDMLDPPNPPCSPGSFDAVFVSPVYGNRMSDHHDAREKCKSCKGTGLLGEGMGACSACPKCDGLGRRQYKRMTYTHQLGRKLHPDNTGQMQWGEHYRQTYRSIWTNTIPLLRPGGWFLLNCSDHIRKGQLVRVTQFHVDVLKSLGMTVHSKFRIPTQRMRFGANANLRADYEELVTLQKS